MPTRPPIFTPARVRQAVQILGVLALLFVLTSLLKYLQTRHKYVDTTGDIVYASDEGSPGHHHIFLIKVDGTGKTQLTTGNNDDSQPQFSPDGSSITFISDRSGSNQVYVMDAKADEISQISTGSDPKADPKFSPDGNSVAYLSRGQILETDTVSLSTDLIFPLSNMPTNGNNQTGSNQGGELGGDSSIQQRVPVTDYAFCPQKVSGGYNITAIQNQPDTDIDTLTLIPADSNAAPSEIAAGNKLTAAWSNDGSQLAVATIGIGIPTKVPGQFIPQSLSGILFFNTDGTPVNQPLIAGNRSATVGPQNPSFMVNKSAIAFDLLEETKILTMIDHGIWVAQATPGTEPNLVAPPDAHGAQFSPDGNHVLFIGPGPVSGDASNITVVDLQAHTSNDLTPGVGDVTSAHWSPALPKTQ